MYCLKCGQKLPDEAQFCLKCGEKKLDLSRKVWPILVAVIISLFVTGFGCGPEKPSPDQIGDAISEYIGTLPPRTWCKKQEVDGIDIVMEGEYNKDGKYWPVKASVTAMETCKTNMLLNNWETGRLDYESDYRIYLDDYGQWKAHEDEEARMERHMKRLRF